MLITSQTPSGVLTPLVIPCDLCSNEPPEAQLYGALRGLGFNIPLRKEEQSPWELTGPERKTAMTIAVQALGFRSLSFGFDPDTLSNVLILK